MIWARFPLDLWERKQGEEGKKKLHVLKETEKKKGFRPNIPSGKWGPPLKELSWLKTPNFSLRMDSTKKRKGKMFQIKSIS